MDHVSVDHNKSIDTKSNDTPNQWPDTIPEADTTNTIFVRNIPYTLDNDQFTKLFVSAGYPVKRAFIVVQRKSLISRGFGFVTFNNTNDIDNAIQMFNNYEIDGRTLLVDRAKPDKPEYKTKSSHNTGTDRINIDNKPIENTTLLVSHIPLNTKSLDEYITSLHGIQSIIFPSIESTKHWLAARILFYTIQQLQHAELYFNEKCRIKSVPTRAIILNTKQINKLIIRNLSFNTTLQQLQDYFSPIGQIHSCTLPLKPGTKQHGGFGFVVYNNLIDAQHAIEQLNGTLLNGRVIAVDYTIDKNTYINTLDEFDKHKLLDNQQINKLAEDKAKLKEQRRIENIANRDRKRAERGEVVVSDEHNTTDITDRNTDITDNNSVNTGDESSDDDMNDTNDIAQPSPPPAHPTNITPQSTIFIRNVSYDTTEQQLFELFTRYGKVNFAKIVMDKQLNRPKGTAFVQFNDDDTAQHVLKISSSGNPQNDMLLTNAQRKLQYSQKSKFNSIVTQQSGTGITLNGRTLHCVIAVSRDDAHRLESSEDAMKRKDKRNLYLMNEGYISPDSDVGKSMNQNDLAKRQQMYNDKKSKLKNVNYSISRTRLSIRNLPITCDEKQLKSIFLHALKSTADVNVDLSPISHVQPIITQCKVARSVQKFDTNGLGKSKRYGFIEFNEHLYSLKSLRVINNNPAIFTATQRPIVEFALVDARKAYIAQQKLIKIQAAQRLALQQQTSTTDNKTKQTDSTSSTTNTTNKRKRQPRRAPLSVFNKKPAAATTDTNHNHKQSIHSNKKQKLQPNTSSTSDNVPATRSASQPAPTDVHTNNNQQSAKPGKFNKPVKHIHGVSSKKELAEEKKFNKLISQYKNKLFGDGDTHKPVVKRWYDNPAPPPTTATV